MAFSGTTFVNVAGASNAAAGQTVQSAVWNNIFIDYEAAMTQLNSQYSSVCTNRNILWCNGGLEVWQRGAGAGASISLAASAGNPYTADRWYVVNGANQAMTVSAQTGLVSESYRAAKIQRNSGQTGTGTIIFAYPLDTDELTRLLSNKATITCLLKAGANFSGGTITVALITGTGVGGPTKALAGGSAYTSPTTVLSVTTSLAATASALVSATSTGTVGTTVTQAELQISFTPSGTADVDDSITVDDVAVEAVTTGYSLWTVMSYDRVPFHTMLEGCKRYYQKTFNYSTAPANSTTAYTGGVSPFTTSTPGLTNISVAGIGDSPITWNMPVELRRAPASSDLTIYNPVNAVNNTAFSTNGGGTNVAIRSYWALQTKQIVVDFTDSGTSYMFANMTVTADI